MARGLPFTYGPSRTALESSTARAMGVVRVRVCRVRVRPLVRKQATAIKQSRTKSFSTNIGTIPQENLAAVADAASLCFFGFFSRKSSITQKVLVRLILF